jgi:16S rRNA (guanine527-N7)-methyltransferase
VKHGPAAQLIARSARLGVALSNVQAGELVALVDRLLCEPQNLTAIDDVFEAVDRHLADSLAALALEELAGPRVLDLGSGGGFPGLVIARMRPQFTVTLVESERRKCEWLARASADLPNVRIVADRSESLAKRERETQTTVTARAVAPLVSTIELAAPLVEVGGHLLIWTSASTVQDGHAARAAELLGLGSPVAHSVEPFPGARRRILVLPKLGPTPPKFPRRAGRATARPLVGGAMAR